MIAKNPQELYDYIKQECFYKDEIDYKLACKYIKENKKIAFPTSFERISEIESVIQEYPSNLPHKFIEAQIENDFEGILKNNKTRISELERQINQQASTVKDINSFPQHKYETPDSKKNLDKQKAKQFYQNQVNSTNQDLENLKAEREIVNIYKKCLQ